MLAGVFGGKIGMTQMFDTNGAIVTVTLVQIFYCQISQIKITETDGYNAIQLAYFEKEVGEINKPIAGHLKKSGNRVFQKFGEFKVSNPELYKLEESFTADQFKAGQHVKVTGKSIGKGFTGNQKRHNFSRGPMTHGSKNHRLPGSIGAGSTPGRVYPGKKMAGQLGHKKVTTKSEIFFVNKDENILALKGSLPGPKGGELKILVSR